MDDKELKKLATKKSSIISDILSFLWTNGSNAWGIKEVFTKLNFVNKEDGIFWIDL